MWAERPVLCEALLSAATGAAVAALLVWHGPPGTDLAAHAYQRMLFLRHGFTLWDDFWYAGRYSFVGYSVLYYPLSALLGIRVLAVATVAVAALAFAAILGREWGPLARWSSRSFAVVWAGIVLSAAFPFALGVTLALLALWALQTGHRWRFAALTLLTLAASPVALVLLVVVLAGVALARRATLQEGAVPALALIGAVAAELALLRLFPGTGRYPFPATEAAAALGYCGLGLASTWRLERARVLRFSLAAYAVAIAVTWLVPSGLGENVTRIRYIALPLAVLVFALRRWRPLPLALGVVALALAWNLNPLAAGWASGKADATSHAVVWRTSLAYLHAHLRPGYRVEAVDTAERWPAFYLAEDGTPLARGWFRQDDFPIDSLLYRRLPLSAYLHWLRELGVAYVVLTDAPPDYSSRAEGATCAEWTRRAAAVFTTRTVSIYAVPQPRPIVTGPGRPTVLALRESRLLIRVSRAGTYRVSVHWSPYWKASTGCLAPAAHGMLRLRTVRAGDHPDRIRRRRSQAAWGDHRHGSQVSVRDASEIGGRRVPPARSVAALEASRPASATGATCSVRCSAAREPGTTTVAMRPRTHVERLQARDGYFSPESVVRRLGLHPVTPVPGRRRGRASSGGTPAGRLRRRRALRLRPQPLAPPRPHAAGALPDHLRRPRGG